MRPVSVTASDLVYLRHILEASEGLGFVIGNKGGDVLLVSSTALADDLDAFIFDMQKEMTISVGMTKMHQEIIDAVE